MPLLYCGNDDNKYGTGIHSCLNILVNRKKEDFINNYDFIVVTDHPKSVSNEVTINVDVNLDLISNEYKSATEILEDTYVTMFLSESNSDEVIFIPAGTTFSSGATSVNVSHTYYETTIEQIDQPMLDKSIRGFPNNLVIDNTGTEPVIREKNESEKVEDRKEHIKSQVKEKRNEVESSGYTLTNGVTLATNKSDQDRIGSAVLYLQDLPSGSTIDWKSESGWVQISLDDLKGFKNIIGGFVQSCFSAEKQHHIAIDALTTLAECDSYNLEQFWPSNIQA